jgi:hypothetical protein
MTVWNNQREMEELCSDVKQDVLVSEAAEAFK